jgi:hypothetical protein
MPIVKSNNMQNTNEESLLLALFFNMLGGEILASSGALLTKAKILNLKKSMKYPSCHLRLSRLYPRKEELVHYAPSVKPVSLGKWVKTLG